MMLFVLHVVTKAVVEAVAAVAAVAAVVVAMATTAAEAVAEILTTPSPQIWVIAIHGPTRGGVIPGIPSPAKPHLPQLRSNFFCHSFIFANI